MTWFDLIWFDFARTWAIRIPEKKWYLRIHRRQSTQRIDTIWPEWEYISKLNSNFKSHISNFKPWFQCHGKQDPILSYLDVYTEYDVWIYILHHAMLIRSFVYWPPQNMKNNYHLIVNSNQKWVLIIVDSWIHQYFSSWLKVDRRPVFEFECDKEKEKEKKDK